MENSVWRIWARVVAYFNLIATVFTGILYVLCFGVGIWMMFLSDEEFQNFWDKVREYEQAHMAIDQNDVQGNTTLILVVYWIFMAIFTAGYILQIWLTMLIMKATKYGQDTRMALQWASTWRNVNIFFLCVLLVLCVFALIPGKSPAAYNLGSLVWNIFVELVFLFAVHAFIKELKTYLTTGGTKGYDQKLMV